jgi:hypothetical protein
MTGEQLEYFDPKNIPEKFKRKWYPTPWMTPEHPDIDEDQEIDDTLDSIRQAEIIYGYKKEHRTWHPEGTNWDYYSHYKKTPEQIDDAAALHASV